jgi:hypothetical protein
MRKLLLLLVAVATLSVGCVAQELRRFEVGIQTTGLRTEGQQQFCFGCPTAHWAFGPAFTTNINRTYAIDTSFSISPSHFAADQFVGGRMIAAFAGLKGNLRNGRWTLYAKARPGVVSWSRTITGVSFPPGDFFPFTFQFGRRTDFALDLSAGIEGALSRHLSLRLDAGDMRIRVMPGNTTDNFQLSSGLYYRTGAVIARESPSLRSDTHRFVDKTNIALWTASLLAQTADAVTTQRFLGACRRSFVANDPSFCNQLENNPVARPFVNHGWGGEVALATIVTGTQTTVQYIVHRWGHHRVERFLLVPQMVGNGIAAYDNMQFGKR